MGTVAPKQMAPASAQSRATKIDRVKYLEEWALDHPLETIAAATAAVREKFGIGLGNAIISDTMRQAKFQWEQQRQVAARHQQMMVPPQTTPMPQMVPTPMPQVPAAPAPQAMLEQIIEMMRICHIRLVELLVAGGIRVELITPSQGPESR